MITLAQLNSIMPRAGKQASAFLPWLNQYMAEYGIDTPARQAAFLAQLAHESAEFTHLSENLNYSAEGLAATWPNRFRGSDGKPNAKALALHRKPEAIANCVYADRMGNGNEASGDGWKNRGRGGIHLTGADNLKACSQALGVDLRAKPELLEQPQWAVASSCWFWSMNGLNQLADKGSFITITKRINGGMNGHAQRVAYWERAKKAIPLESEI